MYKEGGFKWKLGAFVIIGLLIFVGTIYFVGRQKNFFGSTFTLRAEFKSVSGLKVGNNVRLSGINIGTVDAIEMITDTSVLVSLVIEKDMQKFIKTDAMGSIGSDGLMGDKVFTIIPGTGSKPEIKDGDMISVRKAIDMEDVMLSLKTSVDNAGIITDQLAQFTSKMNDGKGALSKLIGDEGFSNSLNTTLVNLQTTTGQFAKFSTKMNEGDGLLAKLVNDEEFGNMLDTTMANLQSGTKGVSDITDAAKGNFLLKGFFNKKEKAAAKKIADAKKLEDARKKKELKAAEEKKKNTPIVLVKDTLTSK